MYVALENIRSLYNVGAILRTASFFGIKQVLLVGYSGARKIGEKKWLHEKVSKTALGAEKNLKIMFLKDGDELIKFGTKNSLQLTAMEQDKKSVSLKKWRPRENSIMVFGNEVKGVSKKVLEAASEIIEIPRQGKKGSLNVAIVAGIVLSKAI